MIFLYVWNCQHYFPIQDVKQNQNATQQLWCPPYQHIFSCPTSLYIFTDSLQYFRPKAVSIDGWRREHGSLRDIVLTGQPPQSCWIPLHPGELLCLFWTPPPSRQSQPPSCALGVEERRAVVLSDEQTLLPATCMTINDIESGSIIDKRQKINRDTILSDQSCYNWKIMEVETRSTDAFYMRNALQLWRINWKWLSDVITFLS